MRLAHKQQERALIFWAVIFIVLATLLSCPMAVGQEKNFNELHTTMAVVTYADGGVQVYEDDTQIDLYGDRLEIHGRNGIKVVKLGPLVTTYENGVGSLRMFGGETVDGRCNVYFIKTYNGNAGITVEFSDWRVSYFLKVGNEEAPESKD